MEQDEIDAFGAVLAAKAVPVSVEEFRASSGWGSSPTMKHKLAVEREKNAYMRVVVDVIRHPTDR